MRTFSPVSQLSVGAVCLCLAFCGPVSGQTIIVSGGEIAAVAAQKYEEKLRAAGIRLTPDDIKAIQIIEKQRAETLKLYRDLAHFANAYQEKKNTDRYNQIKKEMHELRIAQKELPSNDATVGGYYLEVKRYLNTAAKKHSEKVQAIRKNMETYAKEVKPVDPLVKDETSTTKPDPKVANLVVDVISVDGEVEFFINEEKVTKAKQLIKLDGKGTLTLRVVALGKRRKAIRTTKAPTIATVLAQGDYRWHYEVKNNKGTLSTLWTVEDEKYTWTVTKQPNLNAMLFPGTSEKNPALENDALVIQFNGVFTYGATVNGEVNWKADSDRYGVKSTMKETDKAAGSILFTVRPPG